MRDIPSIASPARLPRRLLLAAGASILAPTDRPYALVGMPRHGGDGGLFIRDVSASTWDYCSRLAGVTDYGTRVPMEVQERVRPGGRW